MNRVNILLIGRDYNHTNKGILYTKGDRSDSIVLLSLDMDRQRVSALSIPRDTRVTASDGVTGKINGTYARGGAKLLTQTVGQLLGVTPDYYIAVKPDAVKNIVDSLGGVEVETIDFMKYDDNWGGLHVDLPKGKQFLNGTQAVGFARFREVNEFKMEPDGTKVRLHGVKHSKEEGDPRRMARQQQLIRAMAARGKSFTNLFKLDEIINTGLAQIDTNVDRMQIFALAALFRSVPPDEIQSGTLLGHGVNHGIYFFIPDEDKKQAMVDWLLRGDESAANRLTVVAVENGTGIAGAARRVADLLKEQGFNVASAGNAARPDNKTEVAATQIVYGKASVAPRAQRIAQLIGGGTLVKEAKPDTSGVDGYEGSERADVTIVLGRDLAPQYAPRSAQR
jgi:LCP family protein required for cell wall assembly